MNIKKPKYPQQDSFYIPSTDKMFIIPILDYSLE